MASTGSVGQRHFHRIVRALTLVCAVATGVGAVLSFVVYQQKLAGVASGHDIFGGARQISSLTYYLIWFCISLLALAATFQKRYPMLPLYPLLAVLIEGMTFVYFVISQHHMFVAPSRVLLSRFDVHPYLQVEAHTGDFGFGATHDSGHRRTTVNEGKIANPRYVYVFGGSTTYDDGNVDGNTWPSRLSADLGADFVVENYGLPLFSSLESLLQSLFVFRDHPPACAIYYLGANDTRNTHVNNLRVDYSDLHSPSVVGYLRPGGKRSLLVTYSVFIATLDTIINPPAPRPPLSGTTSVNRDPRLERIFHDNIELIAKIDRGFGVKAIFVPEVADYGRLSGEAAVAMPFLRDKDNEAFMARMHGVMKEAAEDAGGIYLADNLKLAWGDADFIDEGHFNAAGSKKLAGSIADDVRRICQ